MITKNIIHNTRFIHDPARRKIISVSCESQAVTVYHTFPNLHTVVNLFFLVPPFNTKTLNYRPYHTSCSHDLSDPDFPSHDYRP